VSDVAGLLGRLVGDDEWSRQAELERLRRLGETPGRLAALLDALNLEESDRRAGARMAVAALASPSSPVAQQAVRGLEEAVRAGSADLRIVAASAMGESGNPALVPALVEALDDPDPNVMAAAADALGELRHPGALESLMARLDRADEWTRVALIVAIGRLRDPAGLSGLEAAAASPGLEGPLVEAIRAIGDPAGLPLLERLAAVLPGDALETAGTILTAHPDVDPPDWVVRAARDRVTALRDRLQVRDDPGVARLLGIAGSDAAAAALVEAVLPPRQSEAAIAGLLAVPLGVRAGPILRHLGEAEAEDQVLLLSLLPPLDDPEAVAQVVPLLHHEASGVRAAAAEALARSPARHSFGVLTGELAGADVAPEVVRAVGALGHIACVALTPLLGDRDPAVRAAAADALGRCADPAVGADLAAALETEEHPVPRRSLLRTLGRIAGSSAVPLLEAALDDPDPETRVVAVEALGSTGSGAAVSPLERALEGDPAEVLSAIRSLAALGGDRARRLIEPHLRSHDVDRRRVAVGCIGAMADDLDADVLEALAADPDGWIRRRAIELLGQRGPELRSTLSRVAAEDPDPEVRAEARRALGAEG
jgi:HEAT repeat protein